MNYERINWENAPSTDTPLDADNLNKMDEALDTLNREVAKTRSDVQEVEETAASLGSQISGIIRLEDGSTTGDAELINGRVGKDGTTYPVIGDAIRGQIGDLRDHVIEVSDEEPEEFYNKIWVKDDDQEIEIPIKAELDAVEDEVDELNERLDSEIADVKSEISDIEEHKVPKGIVQNQYVVVTGDNAGVFANYTGWSRTDYIPCVGDALYIKSACHSIYNAFYTSDKTFIASFEVFTGNNKVKIPPQAEFYVMSNTTSNVQSLEITDSVYGKVTEIDESIYTSDNLFVQGSVKYSDGKDQSFSTRCRTGFIKNFIASSVGTFGLFVYRDGVYLGMMDENGDVSIPQTQTLIHYADVMEYGNDYSFKIVYYNSGTPTDAMSAISIKLLRLPTIDYVNTFTPLYEMPARMLLPDYWETLVSSKNKTVNSCMDSLPNCESLIFFSDLHMNTNELKSAPIIKRMLAETHITDVVFGGDICSAYGDEDILYKDCEMYKWYYGFADALFVRGNHDCYIKESQYAETGWLKNNDFVYNRFFREFNDRVNIQQGKTYYYFDRPLTKTRYIVIDSTDKIEVNTSYDYFKCKFNITQTQVTWFSQTLASTPSGYDVIVISHAPVHPDMYEHIYTCWNNIIEAFNVHSQIDEYVEYMHCVGDFRQNDGKVILVLSGHGHRDEYLISPTGCIHYEVNCDTLLNNGGDSHTHVAGTNTEQAVYAVVVDRDTNKLYSFCYGAGEDKVIDPNA